MNAEQAQVVLARYLAGAIYPPDEVRQAMELVNATPTAAAALRDAFRYDAEDTSACVIHLERAAEFAEMTPVQRQQEALEILEHLEICDRCRQLHQRLSPLWRGPGEELELAFPIGVLLTESRLEVSGPELTQEVLHAIALGAPLSQRFELPLTNEQAVAFEIRQQPRQRIRIQCTPTSSERGEFRSPGAPAAVQHFDELVVQLYDASKTTPASLPSDERRLARCSFVVPPGRWRLRFSSVETRQVWNLELHIEVE